MKKILCSLLIVTILFNFITVVSYCNEGSETDATQTSADRMMSEEAPIGSSTGEDLIYDGKASSKGKSTTFTFAQGNFGTAILGAVLGYITILIDIVPITIHLLMTITTLSDSDFINNFSGSNTDVDSMVDSAINTATDMFFSIEKVVFNRIPLFDINYFNLPEGDATSFEYTIGTGDAEEKLIASEPNITIKESVAKWFYICRLLAMTINLGVLIYIGIRMAISTIASDQAKYKKMLISWIESMIILFVLQYIMIILINIGNMFENICLSLRTYLLDRGATNFETDMIETIYFAIFRNTGFKVVLYSIMFWFLILSHVRFFITYLKRFLMIGFLIAIAPLITITYSIDKIGDERAQAFSIWMKEFMVNIFIQPLHAIIYLVFMFTAGEIATIAPFVALIFLISLGRAEKIIKTIFSLRGMVSIRSVAESLTQNKG